MAGKMTRGTLKACACPWCGRANNFEDLKDFGIEVGNTYTCDHCKRTMELKKAEPVMVLYMARAR